MYPNGSIPKPEELVLFDGPKSRIVSERWWPSGAGRIVVYRKRRIGGLPVLCVEKVIPGLPMPSKATS